MDHIKIDSDAIEKIQSHLERLNAKFVEVSKGTFYLDKKNG